MRKFFIMEFKPYREDYKTMNVLSEEAKVVQTEYISKVYIWMSLALAVTGLCAHYVANSPSLIHAIITNRILFFGMIIAELGLVVYLSARIHTMSFLTAVWAFLIYSLLNGATLSVLFMAYTASSIATTFYITAGTFIVMSIFGYTTKSDLTSFGRIFMMLLIGLIIASVVNLFLHNETMYWIISYVGVAVFVGLIAYDTQKIKNYFAQAQDDEEMLKKVSILGALTLYLDFVNLFIFLLRFFGARRD